MMKKSFLMIAVCAMFAVSVTSCKKDEDKTGSDYLIEAKNGWKLTSAISTPAYVSNSGTKITDLIKGGFLQDCEVDDIMYFKENGSQLINPGKDKKTTNPEDPDFNCAEMGEKSLGNWKLADDDKSFTSFFIPYFEENYGKLGLTQVVTLDENNLTVNVKINDGKNNVTFTLIYAKQ
jgi:hypothetical protein